MAGQRKPCPLKPPCEGRSCTVCERRAKAVERQAAYAKTARGKINKLAQTRRRLERPIQKQKRFFEVVRRKYGLDETSYNAMWKSQLGACALCQKRFQSTPHVDHDHTTGVVRGLLCASCNRSMHGVDHLAWIKRALRYRELGSLPSQPARAAGNRFTVEDSPTEVISTVLRDGYAIIENVLGPSDLSVLLTQTNDYLVDATADRDNSFMGKHTKRFGKLLHRIPITRSIVMSGAVLNVVGPLLRRYSPTFQLHFTSIMHVMEGQSAQVLHRDISPFPNPGPTVVVATMWAATDFTQENGATVLVPGSHLWSDDRVPDKKDLRVAEMSAGSVLIYVGNLIHGAGKCVTGSRTGLSLQYCVGWMRQEENQYVAVPIEEARGFDEPLQRLMGYDLAARHWGYVDQTHPMNFLNQTDRFGGLDPEGYEFPGRVTALLAVEDGVHLEHRYHVTLDDA